MTLLFADEASFYRQPSQGWLWAHMGRRQPKLPYGSRANTVMRVVGLLDAAQARVHGWDFSRISAREVASCFAKIGSLYPSAQRIYLVLDNWPPHLHSQVKSALKAQARVHTIFLPTYAPWLNNIEKLWRWIRQRVTHAHSWCDDFRLFRQHVLQEFEHLSSGSPELRRYCGLEQLFS